MKLKVLDKAVLVKRDPIKDIRAPGSLIEIPEAYKAAYEKVSGRGTVLSIGQKVKYVKVGMRILFAPYASNVKVCEQDTDLIVIQEDDILAEIEDDRPETCSGLCPLHCPALASGDRLASRKS